MKRPLFIHKNPYSFILADGVAPFQVLGTTTLSLQFTNVTTQIQAHVARNLCADMILGMNYINKYNLNIDVKQQNISIEYNNRILTMNMDKDFEPHKIPVTSSKPIFIPPFSNRSTKVTIPISSVYSSIVPNSHLKYNTSLIITHTLLNFQNFSANVTFSNTSSYPQVIRKGVCVGYLFCSSLSKGPQISSYSLHKSFGVTGHPGKTPASFEFDADEIARYHKSFGVTGYSGTTPAACDFDTDNIASYKVQKHPNRPAFCNTIRSLNPVVEDSIRALVHKTDNKQQQDQLYSVLVRFNRTFDATKHNIANTPINHVINTVPHSPPACRPYPQPDKEEAMYKLIQEFLQTQTITRYVTFSIYHL